ncbi:MAG: ribonuclease H-like domain-containing protein [Vicinamibacterales bacterium]
MSNLTERLRGIVKPARALVDGSGLAPATAERSAPGQPPDDRAVAGAALARSPDERLDAALGGSWIDSGAVRCYVVERRISADHYHGNVQVGALAETLIRTEADAPLLANGAPARLPFVFFDLETTGLSGGAGTYAFLVGCSWFDAENGFVTRQYVLYRAADERPMLQAVASHLSTAGALVSFNGRSFDAPLLETRFLYHRLPWIAGRLPHVDVLHPARRFWRSSASAGEPTSCSLGTLERLLLGADRPDDVPGFEVPARYFQFVRSGDARPLAGVLEHNRMDLLSLAALTARLLRLVNVGAGAAGDAREALALGRIFERAGLLDRAADAYERTLVFAGPRRASLDAILLRAEALRGLALLSRRSRRYDQAADRWREILDLPGCPRPLVREAAEALAIHHEHRLGDLVAARSFALRTLDVGLAVRRNDAVRHRLGRLERKMTARTPPVGRPLFTE